MVNICIKQNRFLKIDSLHATLPGLAASNTPAMRPKCRCKERQRTGPSCHHVHGRALSRHAAGQNHVRVYELEPFRSLLKFLCAFEQSSARTRPSAKASRGAEENKPWNLTRG
eukprot:463199-Pelagomonas_calceolata.AAC.5